MVLCAQMYKYELQYTGVLSRPYGKKLYGGNGSKLHVVT
jgi:hypothetical protein